MPVNSLAPRSAGDDPLRGCPQRKASRLSIVFRSLRLPAKSAAEIEGIGRLLNVVSA
jgi:hypothetical protein